METINRTVPFFFPVLKLPSGEIVAIYDDVTERIEAGKKPKEYSEHLEEMVKERIKELEDANKELLVLNSEIQLRRAEAADTGIGIKPEDMDKLFKEFSQIDMGYTRKYEGTGLGLALTKKGVEIR